MKSIVLLLVAIVVVGAAWWLGSPLFLDREVDEPFPYTANAVIPDTMTSAEVEDLMARMATEQHEAVEPMPAADRVAALLEGRFRDVDRLHRGSGSATVYSLAGGERVLRLENFSVTNGPDLRVLLAVHSDPMTRAALDGEGYVELAPLKGNVGDQNYAIPPDLPLEAAGSVVIYCRPFHVLFSVAPLSEAG